MKRMPDSAIENWVVQNWNTVYRRHPADVIKAWEEYRERLVDVIDTPNYCRRCTPAGIGYCRCEIASNE